LLAIVLVLAAVVLALTMKFGGQSSIEDDSYLVLDIHGDMLEYDPPADMLGQLTGGDTETLQRILTNLEMVKVDDRIAGVIVKVSANSGAGLGKLQEIRHALAGVQETGKPVYGYADSFRGGTYYLAAVCDSLYCPRSAYLTFHGLASTTLHIRGLLDKLGIEPELDAIREYKAAAQLIMRDSLTPEAKANRQWILDEIWDLIGQALQQDRGLDEAQIVALMELATLSPDEALAGGMIDDILYWDELEDRLKGEDDEELRVVSQQRYAEEDPADLGLKGKQKIAVVHAQGSIGGRCSGVNPLLGIMMGHETVVGDLNRALDDDDVVAIVLRVDSGGGDSLTSDLIGHAVEVASRTKPVIVSMVDVAASGGYSISYRATQIVADPLTITGSIGSISGKISLAGLYEKLGITTDAVTKGPMALMDASDRPWTPDQRARHEASHQAGFDDWIRDIARARGKSVDEVERLAMGRVFSGRQAVENGLVDRLGGLDTAIALAKDLAEVPADQQVGIIHLPESKDLLTSLLSGDDESAAAAARWLVYRALREDITSAWRLLASGSLAPTAGYRFE